MLLNNGKAFLTKSRCWQKYLNQGSYRGEYSPSVCVILLTSVNSKLSEAGGGGHQTPVVGSIRHQDVPTSGDVHLYTDPQTYLSDSPILYADCEGLAGGEREPKGARSKVLKRMGVGQFEHAKRTKSFEKNRRNLRHSTEREITWATTSERQTREFAVTQLYPRLLYTFSDVVVFVLKNPR